MAFTNVHRSAQISPTKVRKIVDLIRGKRIDVAISLMQMCKNRGAVFVEQALNAARANGHSGAGVSLGQSVGERLGNCSGADDSPLQWCHDYSLSPCCVPLLISEDLTPLVVGLAGEESEKVIDYKKLFLPPKKGTK
mgnify:CR=1 FL=1